jgi:Fur family transcriptional regulator, ferric uptake regulator
MGKTLQKIFPALGKMTKQRLEVLDILAAYGKPISARGIHEKVKHADLASVYRTLNLLEEKSLVNMEIVRKEKLYCLATEPHHHIFCKICGYAEEVVCGHSFGKFKNFSDVHHQLTLTGICAKCAV